MDNEALTTAATAIAVLESENARLRCGLDGTIPTFHGPQFGVSEEKIRAAVNAACNCGGKPLGHGCCPACEVWHRLKS